MRQRRRSRPDQPKGRKSLQSAAMTDYDAIVIGAGHNGLTAATVMARGGLRVLCLEKNHFIGGMASTTELIRGYRFELAGSIQFPVPNQIFEDLEPRRLPHLRAGGPVRQHQRGRPATDPAVLGPGTAPGAPRRDDRDRGGARDGRGGGVGRGPGTRHRPLRRAHASQVARRNVGLRRQRNGAGSHPHRHVRQRDGCRRPLPSRPVEARAGAQHARLPRRQLHLPGPVLSRERHSASPSPWRRRGRRRCRRCAAAWAPSPTTWPGCSSSTAASSAATPRCPASSSRAAR